MICCGKGHFRIPSYLLNPGTARIFSLPTRRPPISEALLPPLFPIIHHFPSSGSAQWLFDGSFPPSPISQVSKLQRVEKCFDGISTLNSQGFV